jgi:hypothetical protein
MPSALPRWFVASTCAVCLAVAALPADAKSKRGARQKAAPPVTYADGQTGAQRQKSEDARLRRECRGRPNAGACLGYAN